MVPFKEQLETLIDSRHVGATYAVCAHAADPAVILRCEIVLRPYNVEENWSASTERHGLVIARGWIDIRELRDAVLENGELVVPKRRFALRSRTGITGWSTSRNDAGAYSALTTAELKATGDSIFDAFSDYDAFSYIQRRLPSFSPPFRDWRHVANYLEFEQPLETDRSASIAIRAPTFALIHDIDVTLQRQLVVTVWSQEKVADLAVVVIADDADWAAQTSAGETWKQTTPNNWQASVDCTQLVGPGTIHLLFREECVHQVRFGIPPLASRAHLALDEQMQWLERLLGTGSKAPSSDGFEVGVANLLALCGLSPIHYGHASHNEFPDVVCAVHENLLLVAECTVTAPPPSKIDDLIARAEHIRARTRVGGETVTLLRVVFTARSESEVAPDVLEDARKNKSVAILCREHLQQLAQMAARGETTETVVRVLLDWISRFGVIKL
jgi:hypothetical protein